MQEAKYSSQTGKAHHATSSYGGLDVSKRAKQLAQQPATGDYVRVSLGLSLLLPLTLFPLLCLLCVCVCVSMPLAAFAFRVCLRPICSPSSNSYCCNGSAGSESESSRRGNNSFAFISHLVLLCMCAPSSCCIGRWH